MSTTKESMIAVTDRLRREGRWEEAQRYRDQVRKALLVEGKKRAEAREASWEAMIEEYPPLPDAPEAGAAVLPEGEAPAEWANAGAPELTGDFLRVYANLGNSAVKPSDAPGPGSWNMFTWAGTWIRTIVLDRSMRENANWRFLAQSPRTERGRDRCAVHLLCG